jgi:hypothetical protein
MLSNEKTGSDMIILRDYAAAERKMMTIKSPRLVPMEQRHFY